MQRSMKPGSLCWLTCLRVRPGLWELMLDNAVHMLRRWLGGGSSSRNRGHFVQYFKMKF